MIFENSLSKDIVRRNIKHSPKWSLKYSSRFLRAAALNTPSHSTLDRKEKSFPEFGLKTTRMIMIVYRKDRGEFAKTNLQG